MFYTCRKLYGPAAAIVAVTLAAFFLSAPPYAKFGNVKEQYMIACMVIAACTLLLRYADGGWWWLLVSGAAAINAYFFKQTGVSVIVAMAVFIILQPMLKQRSWKIMAQDIALLFAGAVIGLIPLMIFFAGHDQLFSFIARIPGLGFIKGRALAKVSSGYVEASREASDFDTQIQSVLGYYLSFVLPIGLALSALGWWIYQTGKKLKNRKSGKRILLSGRKSGNPVCNLVDSGHGLHLDFAAQLRPVLPALERLRRHAYRLYCQSIQSSIHHSAHRYYRLAGNSFNINTGNFRFDTGGFMVADYRYGLGGRPLLLVTQTV